MGRNTIQREFVWPTGDWQRILCLLLKATTTLHTQGPGVEDAAEGCAAGPSIHQRLLACVPDVQQLLRDEAKRI